MTSHQDWKTTVLNPTKVDEKKNKGSKVVLSEQHSRLAKIDNCTGDESMKHSTVSYSLRMEIQKARNAKNMTQKQLAKEIGVQPKVIHDYESGKAIPSKHLLREISKKLGVKLSG